MIDVPCSPHELLAEIRVPRLTAWGAHDEKLQRVAQAWRAVYRAHLATVLTRRAVLAAAGGV
jgi:hypothetical protein